MQRCNGWARVVFVFIAFIIYEHAENNSPIHNSNKNTISRKKVPISVSWHWHVHELATSRHCSVSPFDSQDLCILAALFENSSEMTAKKPRMRIRMWVEMNRTQAFYWGRPKTNSLFVLINKPHFCVLWETADFFVLFRTKTFFRSGFFYRPKSAASQ